MAFRSQALLSKSKDAILAAIEIYNNPNISFKSEIFIVLSIIAWTYLVHGRLRQKNVDYRYFHLEGTRKIFDRTANGSEKYWSLYDCILGEYYDLKLDSGTKANLEFLLGIRHEIEHQMTNKIDAAISSKIQANCMDYNEYLVKWFGKNKDLSLNISYSLQLSQISEDQANLLIKPREITKNIQKYIQEFDTQLSNEVFQSPNFAYRVIFTPKLVNHPGQADQVIEFIPSNTELSRELNNSYAIIKETEKPKYLRKQIIQIMHEEGYTEFGQYQHTQLWKRLDAKNPQKNYGTFVSDYWYWYENWISEVRKYCKEIYNNK